MPDSGRRKFPFERLEDLFREIGTLLIALTPLDAVLWNTQHRWAISSVYIAAGVVFVASAMISEQRRERGL